MKYLETLRNTGRTTRMLQRAIALDKQGRAVYIVASNDRHAKALNEQLAGLDTENTIKVETANSLANFDWETMSLKRAHPNCVVLVDHWAIQQRFEVMLQELHRYDLP
jgi:hypothetical protein